MTPTREQLDKILADHALWLGDPAAGAKADLGGADLRGAELRGAELRGADLGGADLRGAYLRGAELRDADLRGADLRGADLRGAYLGGAYLGDADLRGAYLRGADLRGASINWNDHYLVTELLKREAGNHLGKLAVAAIPRLRLDWCWRDLLALDIPHKRWALGVLAEYVRDGDNAPAVLRDLAANRKAKADKK